MQNWPDTMNGELHAPQVAFSKRNWPVGQAVQFVELPAQVRQLLLHTKQEAPPTKKPVPHGPQVAFVAERYAPAAHAVHVVALPEQFRQLLLQTPQFAPEMNCPAVVQGPQVAFEKR